MPPVNVAIVAVDGFSPFPAFCLVIRYPVKSALT